MISLSRLAKVNSETSYELKHNGDKFVTYIRVSKLENETRLIFEPFIRIKNCLPIQIDIGLLIENHRKEAAEG